ncbi:hypothetical protein PsYK624_114910 [Phanerochaete sordida]|uniref:Uncharacterized protein n=1 Tax=Phanerochaete sordida TaxID=48140 RepID=A0A9P3LIL9_9APHY|nr:hypothetical protein PsYK624_114910 [Phanerochaete sordida]
MKATITRPENALCESCHPYLPTWSAGKCLRRIFSQEYVSPSLQVRRHLSPTLASCRSGMPTFAGPTPRTVFVSNIQEPRTLCSPWSATPAAC